MGGKKKTNIYIIHMIQPLEMVKSPLEFKNHDLHDLFLETLF